jgi:hypothetical protein
MRVLITSRFPVSPDVNGITPTSRSRLPDALRRAATGRAMEGYKEGGKSPAGAGRREMGEMDFYGNSDRRLRWRYAAAQHADFLQCVHQFPNPSNLHLLTIHESHRAQNADR